ncbi:ATP-grasp domain-containing protein [Alishewanella longhuensis]
MLERAEDAGTLIINKPQSLRDANEKLYTSWFSQYTPKTLVSRDLGRLKAFYQQEQDVILKPLDGMGGASIFRLKPDDANVSVIIETLTEQW